MRGGELPSSRISFLKNKKIENKMKDHFGDETNLSASVNFKEKTSFGLFE